MINWNNIVSKITVGANIASDIIVSANIVVVVIGDNWMPP